MLHKLQNYRISLSRIASFFFTIGKCHSYSDLWCIFFKGPCLVYCKRGHFSDVVYSNQIKTPLRHSAWQYRFRFDKSVKTKIIYSSKLGLLRPLSVDVVLLILVWIDLPRSECCVRDLGNSTGNFSTDSLTRLSIAIILSYNWGWKYPILHPTLVNLWLGNVLGIQICLICTRSSAILLNVTCGMKLIVLDCGIIKIGFLTFLITKMFWILTAFWSKLS